MNLTEQLERLGQEASGAMAGLQRFREALRAGTLHVCTNCQHFLPALSFTGIGRCSIYSVETWPFMPFWCVAYRGNPAPTALMDVLRPDVPTYRRNAVP